MKKLIAVFLFSLSSLSLCFGQTGSQFILQVQNSGTAVYTASSFAVLNLTSGCSGTVSGGVLSITCTGSGGGVTSVATTAPIAGGTITTTGTITCATCVTSAASLTSNAVEIGGGSQASSTISADTTTTHALFATAGAPAFRAMATGDLPTAIPIANVGSAGLSGTAPATISAAGAIGCATCVTSAASLANGGIVLGTAGTQASATNTQFTFAAPTLTVGLAGTSSGILALTGSTSGSATFTAPAVAGTTTNAVISSNAISAPSYAATGATAGFAQLGQGSTNAVGTTDITEQAPAAVTSYLVTKPGTAASGLAAGTNASGTITQNFTGSTAFTPATVTIGSGTSIGATSLCSTTNCPAGNYQVNVYVEVTTACTTTGSYAVWLGYTDDAGAKTGSATTTSFPLTGNGTTPITSAAGASLVPTSTTDYATGQFFLHTTGAATSALGSINYGTTAGACGTGGPMVGKMFLTVVPLS